MMETNTWNKTENLKEH